MKQLSIAVRRRGRPPGATDKAKRKPGSGKGGLASWIFNEARKLSNQTGVAPERVIEDSFKAGFVAVRESYANLIQYRKSLDQLWEGRNESPNTEGDSEESYRNGGLGDGPDVSGAVSLGDAAEDPTLDGLGDADVGPGPSTKSEADHQSASQSISDHLVSSNGGSADP